MAVNQLTIRQRQRNNRMCGEEALARGKQHFIGMCTKNHGSVLHVIRITKTRWYYQCTECVKAKDRRIRDRKTEDATSLARKRANMVKVAEAWRNGQSTVKIVCAYHGKSEHSLLLTKGRKQVLCRDCQRCKTANARNHKRGLLPMLHQWIVADMNGEVPDPKTFRLPQSDRIMCATIGDERCFMELEFPWWKVRIPGLKVKQISEWRIEKRPDFIYVLPQPPTHLLMGSMVKKLPFYRWVTNIHVVRLKENIEDSIDTLEISSKYKLVAQGDWFEDGGKMVRFEHYALKNYGE